MRRWPALARLALVAAAWAAGVTIALALGLPRYADLCGAVLAIGAYAVLRGGRGGRGGRRGRRGGETKYWRGRRIDDGWN